MTEDGRRIDSMKSFGTLARVLLFHHGELMSKSLFYYARMGTFLWSNIKGLGSVRS